MFNLHLHQKQGLNIMCAEKTHVLLHLLKLLLHLGFKYFREGFGYWSRSVRPLMGISQRNILSYYSLYGTLWVVATGIALGAYLGNFRGIFAQRRHVFLLHILNFIYFLHLGVCSCIEDFGSWSRYAGNRSDLLRKINYATKLFWLGCEVSAWGHWNSHCRIRCSFRGNTCANTDCVCVLTAFLLFLQK